jgi:hypothetical protein
MRKIWRSFRTAATCSVLCVFVFPLAARCQDHPDRPPSAASSASAHPSADEKILFDAANQERTNAGLQPLKWDEALAAAALQHAHWMAREHLLSHQYNGEAALDQRTAQAGAKFSKVAENVALGSSAERIHSQWMRSPGHRENIMDPQLTAVGIAALAEKDGIFAVQDFSRSVESLSLEQQEAQMVGLLRDAGMQNAKATADGRKICAVDNAAPTSVGAGYVFHFQVSDLSKLPPELLQEIRSAHYRKAAVGACVPGDGDSFTTYRMAVVLYRDPG